MATIHASNNCIFNRNFKFIGNAGGIFTGSKGSRILCDPWIVDGVFEDAWYHYPPLNTKLSDIQDVDGIYVSHIHPDHYDERNFDFPKNIPLIILNEGPNFLKKNLINKGYNNFIEAKDNETIEFKEFQQSAMRKILSDYVRPGDDVIEQLFNEKKFYDAMFSPTGYGESVLKETFGEAQFKLLRKAATRSKFIVGGEKVSGGGDLFTRGLMFRIIFKPLQALPQFGMLRSMSYLLGSKRFTAWLAGDMSNKQIIIPVEELNSSGGLRIIIEIANLFANNDLNVCIICPEFASKSNFKLSNRVKLKVIPLKKKKILKNK